uniref:(northern house mosquito) hypothetical protein n=1 Tax=Culex pipiens TaxID=7175 RepID=A0A8D8N5N5_CULPI
MPSPRIASNCCADSSDCRLFSKSDNDIEKPISLSSASRSSTELLDIMDVIFCFAASREQSLRRTSAKALATSAEDPELGATPSWDRFYSHVICWLLHTKDHTKTLLAQEFNQ